MKSDKVLGRGGDHPKQPIINSKSSNSAKSKKDYMFEFEHTSKTPQAKIKISTSNSFHNQ